LERLSSLGQTTPEVPKIKMGSPIDFFDDLCRKTDVGKKLPTWKGELYLELHRGVGHSAAKQRDVRLMARLIPRRLVSRRVIGIWRPF